MINRFFLIGSGIAVAGTGTGVGIYYATKENNKESKENKMLVLGTADVDGKVTIPKGDDSVPEVTLRS